MRKLLTLVGIVLILAAVLVPAIPAYADQANPDRTPTIERMRIYRNLITSGDVLVLWISDIPYNSLPSSKVGDAFYWELFETDATTPKAYIDPMAFHDNGYNYSIASIYFGPSDGYVWNTQYILKLIGTSAAFTAPPTYSFTIATTAYTSATTQSDNQQQLADEVIYIAQYLNNRWNLTGDASLLLETEVKTVLSLDGEATFRAAIIGLQAMAPSVFRYAIGDNLTFADRSWNSSYNTSLANQYAGTWVETSLNYSKNFMGTGDTDWLGLFLLLIMCVALIIGNMSISSDHWNGLVDAAFILVLAARIGTFSLVYLIIIMAVFLIYLGMRIWRMIPT